MRCAKNKDAQHICDSPDWKAHFKIAGKVVFNLNL